MDLALDPEFSMGTDGVPGKRIGQMHAQEINDAIGVLEYLQERHQLPRKVLIVHQFTTAMLPDKEKIWNSDAVDIVLAADGFGPPALKRNVRMRPCCVSVRSSSAGSSCSTSRTRICCNPPRSSP